MQPGPQGPLSGPLGTNSSTASNVNTDTELIAGPHNETSIAVNPTAPKHLIGSANDYQLIANPDGSVTETAHSRAHVTFDGGQTWTDYAIPYQSAYVSTGDPAVAFDTAGHAYIATLGFNFFDPNTLPDVVVSHSTDGGRTWTVPSVVAKGRVEGNVAIFNDKEYIAAWGDGNVIVTWTQFEFDATTGDYIESPIYASITHDGGNTWSNPDLISGQYLEDQGSVPVVSSDGKAVYVAFESGDVHANDTGRDQYLAVQLDPATAAPVAGPTLVADLVNGYTDYPINVNGRQTYQDSQFRTWSLGNIAADPNRQGHLAVVWSDMRNSTLPAPADPYSAKTNSDIVVSQSFDGGKSWSAPKAITLPGDQFMPWSTFDNSGRLQIGFFRPLLRLGQPQVRLHPRQRADQGPARLCIPAGLYGPLRPDPGQPLVRDHPERQFPECDQVPGRLQWDRRSPRPQRRGAVDRPARASDVPEPDRGRAGRLLRRGQDQPRRLQVRCGIRGPQPIRGGRQPRGAEPGPGDRVRGLAAHDVQEKEPGRRVGAQHGVTTAGPQVGQASTLLSRWTPADTDRTARPSRSSAP